MEWLPYSIAAQSDAFENQSFLATPELLRLSVRYFNPFLDWILPPELRRLGFSASPPIQFVRACLLFGQENTLWLPGFARSETWLPLTTLAFNQYSLPYLCNGEAPPPMPEEDMRAILDCNPTCSEYYQRDYARLYRQSA